jgi:hypothetical protein
MNAKLTAGSAVRDLSPNDSQFLYGYPHVPRYSTGIHDPLLSSALYISSGKGQALIIANDIICLSKSNCQRVRNRIEAATGVPESHIMITATHTHSGPVTVTIVSNASDDVVPAADPAYMALLEDRITECGIEAFRAARPAEMGLAVAWSPISCTNRHDPDGPNDREIPVLAVRGLEDGKFIACMVVYALHPTVLHEDSLLVSADFPGMLRQYLQDALLGPACPVLYHLGPAGNQSPRYAIQSKDFASARRLGHALGAAIEGVIPEIHYESSCRLAMDHVLIDLIPRPLPDTVAAAASLKQARHHLESLRQSQASPEAIRTAECDCFGAEETLALSEAMNSSPGLAEAYASCLPCEIQVLLIGPWAFAAWPGEFFVEYGLAVKERLPDTYVISLANGDLQGYIVTEEAVVQQRYEACNAIFDHKNGPRIVEATERLVTAMRRAPLKSKKQPKVEQIPVHE